MKIILYTFFLFSLTTTAFSGEQTSASISPAEIKVSDTYIKSKEIHKSQEHVSLNRTENRDVRQYAQGDINQDDVADVVVLYGMEGPGNTWNLYLAVFKNPSMKFVADARVGGKGYRSAALKKIDAGIDAGIIELSADLYSPFDAMCCPSVKGTVYYSARNSSLEEERLVVDCIGWKPPERPTK